jgi:hypothetical protein
LNRRALDVAANRILEKAVLTIHALSRRFYFMNTAAPDAGVDEALATLINRVADGPRDSINPPRIAYMDSPHAFGWIGDFLVLTSRWGRESQALAGATNSMSCTGHDVGLIGHR